MSSQVRTGCVQGRLLNVIHVSEPVDVKKRICICRQSNHYGQNKLLYNRHLNCVSVFVSVAWFRLFLLGILS